MPAGQPIPLAPPLGGNRGDVVPSEIPPGFLWRSLNTVDRYGRLRQRPGAQPVLVTGPGGRIVGGQYFRDADSAAHVVAANLTTWFRRGPTSWDDISSGTVTFANRLTDPTRFAVFPSSGVNWLIGVNNRDIPYKWDGASAAVMPVGGSPPVARDVTVCGNFVVLGNVVEFGARASSRVRVSDFNNLDSWVQYGPADLTDSNDDIVGVRALTRTAFAIYKDKSVWMGWAQLGLFPFQLEQMESRPGPCSASAIVRVDQEHYYFGIDARIHRFNGVSAQHVSRAVEFFLQAAGEPTQFRSINRERCWGIFNEDDRNLWFYFPGNTNPDPTYAVSFNVDTRALYLHAYPFALTSGWDGDDVSSIRWTDLTGTWTHIGPGSYPTWASFGGTLRRTCFLGSSQGQVYRQRYDVQDDGINIPMLWEFPLKAWLGEDNISHLDGVESFFSQITSGPLVRIDIGVSDALAEEPDPLYTTLGNHDTSLTARQKFSLPTIDARFWSIRFSVAAAATVQFKGGMAFAWPERAPESQGMVTVPPVVSIVSVTILAGQRTGIGTGSFGAVYMVAVQPPYVTQYGVHNDSPTQFTITVSTPPIVDSVFLCKVITS